VSRVGVIFYPEPSDGDLHRPFFGPLAKGLDQNSTPQDFLARYGEPLRQGRLFGGETALLDLESAGHDVRVVFEVPKNKLRTVTFNAPGYLRGLGR
jgi:hypothetical protein